jgi:hypothetical protein
MDWNYLEGKWQVPGCCEHGNEPSVSIKYENSFPSWEIITSPLSILPRFVNMLYYNGQLWSIINPYPANVENMVSS